MILFGELYSFKIISFATMEDLRSLFIDLLDLSAPYSLGEIEKEVVDNQVVSVTFNIVIDKDYRPSSQHNIHSYYTKKWRHLRLLQCPCFIRAKLPVFIDKNTGKTHSLPVPWARKNSRFTLLFEQDVLGLLKRCNCKKTTAEFFGLYPQRVATIYDAYTKDAYEQREPKVAAKVGVDETSTKKGHDYISLLVDVKRGDLLDIRDGKSSDVLKEYAEELQVLGKDTTKIKDFSLDMSPAFISGVKQYFPMARMTYDRFHVVRLIGRYFKPLWRSKKVDKSLLDYHIKELDQLWVQPCCEQAAAFFAYWLDRTKMLFGKHRLVRSMQKHFEGIINFAESKLTNGILEGINSKIQFIKRAARGYKDKENFKRMILFAFDAL